MLLRRGWFGSLVSGHSREPLGIHRAFLAAHRPLAYQVFAIELVDGHRGCAAEVAHGKHTAAVDAYAEDGGSIAQRPENAIGVVDLRDFGDARVGGSIGVDPAAAIDADEFGLRVGGCEGADGAEHHHDYAKQDSSGHRDLLIRSASKKGTGRYSIDEVSATFYIDG